MNPKSVAMFIALVLLSACASKQTSTGIASTGTIIAQPAVQWNGQVKEFTVRAFRYGFDPDTLQVNLGDKVVIHAYTSDVAHGIYIPDYGVSLRINDKSPVSTEFIADKSGEFAFFCNVPCGSGHGSMRGKLIVKEK